MHSESEKKRTRLFASVECQKEVARLKMSDEGCQYVCPGDQGVCAGFHLFFTTCDHGAGAPDAVGVIIETDGKRVFIAGDTCLRLDRKAEYLARGPIDLLIAPINGAYGNLNEEECAALSEALAARCEQWLAGARARVEAAQKPQEPRAE